MPLTTLDRVRSALPRLASISDSEIIEMIAEASSIIESYCNRSFGPGPFTETFDATGTGVVFLSSTPVASVTSVTTGHPDSPTVLDAASYRFDGLTGELRLGGSGDGFRSDWGYSFGLGGESFQSIVVVYAGASVVPPAVVRVCLNLINSLSVSSFVSSGAPGIKSKTMGQVSVTYADSFTTGVGGGLGAADMSVLNRYRRYSL